MMDPGESTSDLEPSVCKQQCIRTDYKLCLKCQGKMKEPLVNPKFESYSNFIKHVHERARYGDKDYPPISKRLAGVTDVQLSENTAKWHSSCYKLATHSVHLDRARKAYETGLGQQDISCVTSRKKGRPLLTELETQTADTCQPPEHLLRSAGQKLEKHLCFFCNEEADTGNLGPLHQVSNVKSTDDKQSVGKMIYNSVMESKNEVWKAKIQSLNPQDLLAIDLKYHLYCYVKYVQRGQKQRPTYVDQESEAVIAADVEFFSLVHALLKDRNTNLQLDQLLDSYVEIRKKHSVIDPDYSPRALKRKLEQNIEYIEFVRPKYKTSQVVISDKGIADAILQAQAYADPNEDMKSIFRSADLIRSQIFDETRPWTLDGNLNYDTQGRHTSTLLCTLIRWIVLGKATNLSDSVREHEACTTIANICQSITYAIKTMYQTEYTPKEIARGFYHTHSAENPFVVGIAFKVHSMTRSKTLINYLHACGICVDYGRLLRMETQLANAVLKGVNEIGVYILPGFVKGSPVFFASDNVDWNEDTPDGKRTTHATVIVVFQPQCAENALAAAPKLTLENTSRRSIDHCSTATPLQEPCYVAQSYRPTDSTHYQEFRAGDCQEECDKARMTDEAWLTARRVFRSKPTSNDSHLSDADTCTNKDPNEDSPVLEQHTGPSDMTQPIPTWSGFNSLLSSDETPLTCIRTLPLLTSPAHEYSTLISVFRQVQHVSEQIVGPEMPVVLTMDMDLYQRALKLQAAKPEFKDGFVLRIGELHTVLCMLRTIGSFIDGSGFEDAWDEADIYGPLTTRQILEGKHLRRSVSAHLTSLQALFDLYMESCVESEPDMTGVQDGVASEIADVCSEARDVDLKVGFIEKVTSIFSSSDLPAQLESFSASRMKHPMFAWTKTYMEMVLVLLQYIRASRESNWLLHLQSLERFCPYFFAMNRLKYAQCVPEYIAKMYELRESSPAIWKWLSDGNFCVKKSNVSFCKIGVDHALEQVNRSLKVLGGITGITQKPGALSRFFLVAPEISRMAEESVKQIGLSKPSSVKHRELSENVNRKQENNVVKLRDVFSRVNPFENEDPHLMNIVTQAVIPNEVQEDILKTIDAGEHAYAEFVQERITGSKNLWDRMTKLKLKNWKSTGKAASVKLGSGTIELKEDRSLFARMAIVARSRPEMDIATDIGNYEFSCVSRSLFASDGNLLPCIDKSKLMHKLESHIPDTPEKPGNGCENRAIIVDAMALVHELSTRPVKTCEEFANEFVKHSDALIRQYDEGHVIFDHYDVDRSLKANTRARRSKGEHEKAHVCNDLTPIRTPFNKFISNTKTKESLTHYLAQKLLDRYKDDDTPIVVSTSKCAQSNKLNVEHLRSSQEEADTILLLHALDAVKRGKDVDIVSPDTDVFILAVSRYPALGNDPRIVTGTGTKRRRVCLQPVYSAIGPNIAAALPGFHAFTGCDNCGRFQGKGKVTCWNVLTKQPKRITDAFVRLGTSPKIDDDIIGALEEFVCCLYRKKGSRTKELAALRWELFKTSQAEADRLPPTKAALLQHSLRAAYQSIVWAHLEEANPTYPEPNHFGWKELNDTYVPVITTMEPAPKAVIELVRCNCQVSQCSTARCTCRKSGLVCTELCRCSLNDNTCENQPDTYPMMQLDSDSDDD